MCHPPRSHDSMRNESRDMGIYSSSQRQYRDKDGYEDDYERETDHRHTERRDGERRDVNKRNDRRVSEDQLCI